MTSSSPRRVTPRLGFPLSVLVLIVAAAPIGAQQVNYARAEQFLNWNADRLVSGDQVNPQWLKDDRARARAAALAAVTKPARTDEHPALQVATGGYDVCAFFTAV